MRSVMPRPAISDRYMVAMSAYPRALSAMFLTLTLAGCSEQDPEPLEPAPYDAHGPFTVGFRTLEATASGDAPALTVKVWYPAAAGTPAQDETQLKSLLSRPWSRQVARTSRRARRPRRRMWLR